MSGSKRLRWEQRSGDQPSARHAGSPHKLEEARKGIFPSANRKEGICTNILTVACETYFQLLTTNSEMYLCCFKPPFGSLVSATGEHMLIHTDRKREWSAFSSPFWGLFCFLFLPELQGTCG